MIKTLILMLFLGHFSSYALPVPISGSYRLEGVWETLEVNFERKGSCWQMASNGHRSVIGGPAKVDFQIIHNGQSGEFESNLVYQVYGRHFSVESKVGTYERGVYLRGKASIGDLNFVAYLQVDTLNFRPQVYREEFSGNLNSCDLERKPFQKITTMRFGWCKSSIGKLYHCGRQGFFIPIGNQ